LKNIFSVTDRNGNTIRTNDADEYKRLVDDQNGNSPKGTQSIVHRKNEDNWQGDDKETHTYDRGHHEVSRAWIKDQDDGSAKAITAISGAVMQAGQTATSDPAVGSYIQATGTGFAVLGALERMNHFNQLSNVYGEAADLNEQLSSQSGNEIALMDTAISKAKADAENKDKSDKDRLEAKERATQLEARKLQLESARKTQDSLADKYNSKENWQMAMVGIGALQAGALGYVAYQQIENGRRLADDERYCEDNPTEFPRCTNTPPSPEENGPEDTDIGNRNPAFGDPGFNSNGSDLGARGGFDGEPFSGDSLQPGGSESADDASSFLAANSGLTGATDAEKDEDGDSINGYSDDQSYNNVTGDTSVFGSGGYTPSGVGGFDISQFLPSHLRGKKGFSARRMNNKSKKKKGLVLGKDSPSLFTRISKAHKAKELELSREVI